MMFLNNKINKKMLRNKKKINKIKENNNNNNNNQEINNNRVKKKNEFCNDNYIVFELKLFVKKLIYISIVIIYHKSE